MPVQTTVSSARKSSSIPTLGLSDETIGGLVAEARSAIIASQKNHGPVVEVSGPKSKFQVFADKGERDAIVKASVSLAKYMHGHSIPTIVFIDVRARAGYLPFIHAWRRLYGSEQRPEIYFMSPSAAVTLRACDTATGQYNHDSILEQFHSRHKYLAARKDLPVLVYDTCIHMGTTMLRATKLLVDAGFSEIKVGIAEQGIFGEPIVEPSFLLFGSSHGTCSIYGGSRTQLVLRGHDVLSSPNKIREDIADGIRARQELAQMLREAEI